MDNTQIQRQIFANKSDDVPEPQENQINYFAIIPDELLLEIFNKLSQNQLSSLEVICQQFSRLIEDKSLWKKVELSFPTMQEISSVCIETLMRRQVQNLTLCDVTISPLIGPVFDATQSWCLKEVFFIEIQICPDDLTRIFQKCGQLTKVYLECICANNDVLMALSKNRNIKFLQLTWVKGLQPLALENLLENVTKLEELYIDSSISFDPTFNCALFLDSICENLTPSLLVLCFGIGFTSMTDGHIAQIVRNCPQLESLCLYDGELTARSVESLQKLEHLSQLYMLMCDSVPVEAYLTLTTKRKSLVELVIPDFERRNDRKIYIEQLFQVDVKEDYGRLKVGTFQTEFGIVELKY